MFHGIEVLFDTQRLKIKISLQKRRKMFTDSIQQCHTFLEF